MAAELLLVSRGLVHPSLPLRRRFRALLSAGTAGSVETTRSLRRLTALGVAGKDGAGEDAPAAVVLLFHQAEPPAGAVEALERYVHAGGGLLAIHGALASFKGHPRYAALLGSPFAGHGKPGPIDLYPVAAGAASAGRRSATAPATRVRDELYRVELAADAAVRCVGMQGTEPRDRSPHPAADPAAEEHAVCWERRLGAGRVAVVTLGHYARTLADSFVQQLLTDELAWVAGKGER